VAQRVGGGTAILFHDSGTRSSTTRPHFTHGKDPVPILQEVGWAPGPVTVCCEYGNKKPVYIEGAAFID